MSIIQSQKLELAIQAYMQCKVDIREGAAWAGISYNSFMRELDMRNIVTLEADGFLQRLEFLASAFKNEGLLDAVKQVQLETNASNDKLIAQGWDDHGLFKDDPGALELFDEIERERDRHLVGGE